MTVRSEFERDAGFWFSKGNISLLLHAAARFRETAVVTNYDLFNFFKATNRFLQSIGTYDHERTLAGTLWRPDHFGNLEDAQFYKFVREADLHYYTEGSFQFGSIRYYRDIEHQSSKDAMEGLANLAIKTPRHLFGMSLASGYNFGILCGAANLRRQDEKVWRIIRIDATLPLSSASSGAAGERRWRGQRATASQLALPVP